MFFFVVVVNFWTLNKSRTLPSMKNEVALRFHLNDLNLFSKDGRLFQVVWSDMRVGN